MPWPANRHTIFEQGAWSLQYHHRCPGFWLGEIGNPSTPAVKDRALIEETLGEHGPIVHLALAPHKRHNTVVMLEEIPASHVTHVCDAVIVPKGGGPFSVETLLGDCASVIVDGRNSIGFLHIGRAEIIDGLLSNFLTHWFEVETSDPPDVYIGPALSAQFHSIPDPQPIINLGLECYLTPMTVWGTRGFSLTSPIADQFMRKTRESAPSPITSDNIHIAEFCPFSARLAGDSSWASDQWYKMCRPGKFSPRDCAFLHFEE